MADFKQYEKKLIRCTYNKWYTGPGIVYEGQFYTVNVSMQGVQLNKIDNDKVKSETIKLENNPGLEESVIMALNKKSPNVSVELPLTVIDSHV